MQPIIDPLWIYVITCLDDMHQFLHFLFAVSLFAFFYAVYMYISTRDNMPEYGYSFLFNKQDRMLNNIEQLNRSAKENLKILEKTLEDEDDKKKLKILQETADSCKYLFGTIEGRLTKLLEDAAKHDKRLDDFVNLGRKSFIAAVIILLFNILIPTTETGYKLLLTSYITPDNLNTAKDITKETIEWLLNQIVEAVKQMR